MSYYEDEQGNTIVKPEIIKTPLGTWSFYPNKKSRKRQLAQQAQQEQQSQESYDPITSFYWG